MIARVDPTTAAERLCDRARARTAQNVRRISVSTSSALQRQGHALDDRRRRSIPAKSPVARRVDNAHRAVRPAAPVDLAEERLRRSGPAPRAQTLRQMTCPAPDAVQRRRAEARHDTSRRSPRPEALERLGHRHGGAHPVLDRRRREPREPASLALSSWPARVASSRSSRPALTQRSARTFCMTRGRRGATHSGAAVWTPRERPRIWPSRSRSRLRGSPSR
jgi:hypothetical protein